MKWYNCLIHTANFRVLRERVRITHITKPVFFVKVFFPLHSRYWIFILNGFVWKLKQFGWFFDFYLNSFRAGCFFLHSNVWHVILHRITCSLLRRKRQRNNNNTNEIRETKIESLDSPSFLCLSPYISLSVGYFCI